MQKKQFEQMLRQMKFQVRLKPEVQVEEEQLALEAAPLVVQAQKQSKDEVFAWLLGAIPDTMLNQLMDFSLDICPRCVHPATSAFRLLLHGLCARLASNEVGPFSLTDENYDGLARTLHPYFAVEMIRRRRCFQTMELPANPWALDAAISVRGLRPEQLETVLTEIEELRVCPPFHLVSLMSVDNEDGHEIEASHKSIRVPVLVQDRSVVRDPAFNISPHKAPPVDPATLARALADFNNRAKHAHERACQSERKPQLNQAHTPVGVLPEDGAQAQRRNLHGMTGSPDSQTIAVLYEHFGSHPQRHHSATLRLFALLELLEDDADDALAAWMYSTPAGAGMHPAIIEAAATLDLTEAGRFSTDRFVCQVEDIVESWIKQGFIYSP